MACARAGVHDGRPPHRASYGLQVSISMTAAAGHRAAGLLALTFRQWDAGAPAISPAACNLERCLPCLAGSVPFAAVALLFAAPSRRMTVEE